MYCFYLLHFQILVWNWNNHFVCTHINNIIYSFDCTYAYGGSGYGGYINKGEDTDGDEAASIGPFKDDDMQHQLVHLEMMIFQCDAALWYV